MKLYESTGPEAGSQYLLLHGFGSDRFSWTGIAPALNGGVLVAELPGHGAASDASVDSYEALISALSHELAKSDAWTGAEQRHIIGHSLGGSVAISLASNPATAPVDTLTLIAPGGVGACLDGDWLRELVALTDEDAAHQHLKMLVSNPRLIPAAMGAQLLNQLDQSNVRENLSSYLSWLPQLNLVESMRVLNVPVQVIWGAQDCIAPWRNEIANDLSIQPLVLDACGHLPHIEHRTAVLAAIENHTATL